MQLIVVGAGPAYTDRQDASGAAYLVEHDGAYLLLDLGQGSFPRLFPHVEPSRLAGIAITHLHPDHFVDLVAVRHYLRYHFQPPRRLTVHAPAALGDRLDALHAAPGFTQESIDLAPLASGARSVGGFGLEAARVTHTDDSYGFRVTVDGDAPGLVYSGDCGHADDLRQLVRAGDVLLAEVSFGPGPVDPGANHLDGPAVGRVAAAAGASRVLLTHLQMGYDPGETVESVRTAGFEGDVEFVWPGSRITLG